MTDHNESHDRPQGHDGDYDPMVAERFRILERTAPPEVTLEPMARISPSAPTGSESPGARSGFLMAVAACVGVLVIGLGALVAVNSGDGSDLTEESSEGGGEPIVADDGPETTAALVVEGDSGGQSTRSEADGGESDGGSDESTDSADGADGDDGTTDDDDAKSGGAEGPVTTVTGGANPDMTADVSDRTTVTSSATSDQTATTVEDENDTGETVWPKDPDGDDDSTGETVSVRGTVTEVFTDCQSRLILNEAGQVVEAGPVSCDGGSYIVVDGTRIFTSSGFTSADQSYDKHPSNLKPGQDVAVTASRIGGSNGPLSLACDSCRIRIV